MISNILSSSVKLVTQYFFRIIHYLERSQLWNFAWSKDDYHGSVTCNAELLWHAQLKRNWQGPVFHSEDIKIDLFESNLS